MFTPKEITPSPEVTTDDQLPLANAWTRGWKRVADIVVGASLAILATPAVLVLALWSAVRFRAWPFFVQQRVGRDGRVVEIVKIRSLPKRTPSYMSKQELNATGEVTGAWNWMRRSHLDELPQLWQVCGGTLSLVGPRPMIQSIVDSFQPDFRRLRESVRPGVTGLWQISTEGTQQIDPQGKLDEYYIQHASFGLDAWILIVTIWQLLGGPRYEATDLLRNLDEHPGGIRHFDLPHGAGSTPSNVWNFLSGVGFVLACFGAILIALSF